MTEQPGRKLLRRRKYLPACAFLAGLVASIPACADDAPVHHATPTEAQYKTMVMSVINGHIRPGYVQFANDTARLAADVGALCAAPSAPALDAARARFAATATGFLGLLPVRIGPILENNRLERLAFWPDPRGIGLKQVEQLLAGTDDVGSAAALSGKSVAVQGLTALEILLAGKGSESLAVDAERRCRFAQSAAENTAEIAKELVEAWSEDGAATKLFENPGQQNPLFMTHREAAGKIVATAANGLEIVADDMLKPVFADKVDSAKPKRSPFWRTQAGISGQRAALEATRHLIASADISSILIDSDRWLAKSVDFELANAAKTSAKILPDVEAAVLDEKSRSAAAYVYVAVAAQKNVIGVDLAAALDLSLGFNANDGD